VRILKLTGTEESKDLLAAELWERGTAGIQEKAVPGGGVILEAWFEEEFDAAEFGAYAPEWADAPSTDWAVAWREDWEPLAVGERLFLVPDWRDDAAPAGRHRIVVHAGQAPGSGYHPPTRLALRALERCVREGDTVLDVGTGSGILAEASAALGAARVFACDIDPEALAEAKRNGARAHLWVGSARSVGAGTADVTVANLNAEALLAQRRELIRATRQGGTLILAGFQERRREDLREAFGLPELEGFSEGPWRALAFKVAKMNAE
jgi:ribosomal protein L11 methyltransferase